MCSGCENQVDVDSGVGESDKGTNVDGVDVNRSVETKQVRNQSWPRTLNVSSQPFFPQQQTQQHPSHTRPSGLAVCHVHEGSTTCHGHEHDHDMHGMSTCEHTSMSRHGHTATSRVQGLSSAVGKPGYRWMTKDRIMGGRGTLKFQAATERGANKQCI